MRISEIETSGPTLQQVHLDWKRVDRSGIRSEVVWNKAVEFAGGGADPVQAHAQALSAVNSSTDRKQDTAAAQRQADRINKPFVGVPMKPKGTSTPASTNGTRTRGGQIGNQNAYRGGPQTKAPTGPGKNIIQTMKNKWDDFNKADGLAGKSAAKGSMLAKGAGNIAKKIVAMGDKARTKG